MLLCHSGSSQTIAINNLLDNLYGFKEIEVLTYKHCNQLIHKNLNSCFSKFAILCDKLAECKVCEWLFQVLESVATCCCGY